MLRFAACYIILAATCSYGQLTRGYISGTVQDATNAVIPDVQVKIKNRDTNATLGIETNDSGIYRFAGVEPGTYSVEFTKAGFEVRRVENVIVGTNQEVTINQTLGVSGTATTVEVQDSAAGVELAKSTATMGRTLNQMVIQNVPLSGATRDVNVLSLLAPMVNRGPGSTGISANGNRARNNNFMVDGVDNNDASVTTQSSRIIPEALSEFQIQTSAYSAEFGRNSGAQINVITRGGTNQFHGEAWDYYRGNWMEPVNLLNKRAGITSTPRFNHHQFGGDFGGPAIKDRLFFFGLVELNRRRETPDGRNASSFTIPTAEGLAALQNVPLGPGQTAASRQAVLSSLGFLTNVYSQIGNRYDQVSNQTINGVAIPLGTARIGLANPSDLYNWVARTDYRVSDKHNLSYRMLLDKRNEPDVASNLQFGKLFSGGQAIFGQNHAGSLTSSLSSRFTNEFRFSYVRRLLDFPENDPTSQTVSISNAFTIGGSANFPQGRRQNTFQYQDAATYTVGKHSLRFGVDLRQLKLFNNAAFDSKGTWTFNNFADFVNNSAFSLIQAVNTASFDARQLQQAYFFQDDFRVTRDLTVNLGLRYESQGVPFGFFGAATPEIAAVGVSGNVKRDKNNFAPRFGLAYSPSGGSGLFGDGKTVLRGGFGIGYDVLFYNILTVTASNFPRVNVARLDAPETLNAFPTISPRQSALVLNPLTQFVNANSDMQNPTSHFYSFTIQREVAKGQVLEVGYSGNRGYHGIRQGRGNPGTLTAAQAAAVTAAGSANAIPSLQLRRVNPAWGDRILIESTAKSLYNAGFVRYDKRFSNGLVFGGNYTFSKLMSDNDESLGVGDITNSAPQVPQNFNDYRTEWSRSVFDRPHRATAHIVYQIPGRDRFNNRIVKHVLGGWQVSGFYEIQSGQPFGIRTGVDTVGQGATNGSRPDWNPSGIFTKDPVSGDYRTFSSPLRSGAFITPLTTGGLPLANSDADGGNLGRNTFRGPHFKNWNMSLSKEIRITERVRLQLRNDFINAFNQRNFGNPVAAMNAPNFGQNTSNPGNRTMLLSGKIRF
ncbi:MAG: carboxypeptidase regulatory-like domain-containing protein [Bryobacteraceae bacterium]